MTLETIKATCINPPGSFLSVCVCVCVCVCWRGDPYGLLLGCNNAKKLSFSLVFAGGLDASDGGLREDLANMSIQETDQDEITRDKLDIRKSDSLQPR